MCGIAGILGAGEQAAATHAVEAMTATLAHRGPDGGGVASGPGWALGMRRLAVQDTSSAGDQPMTRDDLTIVFNGEVYNFPALRRELEGKGYAFRSGTDTEVVLQAFHRWGTAAFERFNGMFALAIVDARRRRAWLARDRFGKKPLFLARLPGRLLLASELKALMAVEGGALRLDEHALRLYFRYQYVPGPLSIFHGVRKVPPASWIEVDLDTVSALPARRFWTLPSSEAAVGPSAQEVLDEVREATRARLIADVPVGAFLSGGTDSSLVVACMRDAGVEVRTFSIGFEDPRYDESGYARAVAETLGTRHTSLTLTQADAIDLLTTFPTVYDEPFADSSALPTMAVARLAREQVTVALSGDGGDELFGGYARYRAAPYLRWAARLPSSLTRAQRLFARVPRWGGRLGILAQLASARSTGEAYRELVSVWKRDELDRLVPGGSGLDPFAEDFEASCGSVAERMMRADSRTYLVDDILQKVDRATMAVGLEARNPLLDVGVVRLGLASARLSGDAPGAKPLLKAALRLRLPAELVDRPKRGFGLPVGDWMRRELRPRLEDLVLGRRATEYDHRTAHRVCAEHLSGRRDAAPQVWSLLAFELWRERWRQGATAR